MLNYTDTECDMHTHICTVTRASAVSVSHLQSGVFVGVDPCLHLQFEAVLGRSEEGEGVRCPLVPALLPPTHVQEAVRSWCISALRSFIPALKCSRVDGVVRDHP